MSQKHKRRLIVEKEFQYRCATIITGVCLCLAAVLVASMAFFVRLYFRELDESALFMNPVLSRFFNASWYKLVGILSLVSMAYCGVVFVASLWLTRNIAGPLIAFEIRVDQMLSDGKPVPFQLRRRDELRSLVRIFNRISDYVARNGRKAA